VRQERLVARVAGFAAPTAAHFGFERTREIHDCSEVWVQKLFDGGAEKTRDF
jgi:hypothetical protein